MKIGTFIQSPDGSLVGRIHGLGMVTTAVSFEPQTSRDGKGYYRLIADPAKDVYEVGVAFPKQKDGRLYYSVSIDSPMLPQPINAALFQDKGDQIVFNLIWSRQADNDLKYATTPQSYQQAQTQPSRRNDGQRHNTL
jgi:uncharacterized protein (DUF736 family)